MPIIERRPRLIIHLCDHVIPVLRDHGYDAGLGLHAVFVSRGEGGTVSQVAHHGKNLNQLVVTGDRHIAQILLDQCRPFGSELTIHYIEEKLLTPPPTVE